MNKFVVYTVITGKEIPYDYVMEPKLQLKEPDIDYLLFTNNLHIKSYFFKVVYVDSRLNDKDLSRDIKINIHKYLYKYKASLYIDGNVLIKNKLLPIFETKNEFAAYSLKGNSIDEGKYIVINKYATENDVKNRLRTYLNNGFDISKKKNRIYGKILFRKNNEKIKKFSKEWYSEYLHVNRDQLALPYLISKFNIDSKIWGWKRNNDHFKKYFKLVTVPMLKSK